MKRKILNLLIAVLFLAGLAVLIYPAAANYWNQRREKRLINTYEESIQEITPEDTSVMLEEARAYNAGQIGNAVPDAFAEGEHQVDELYERLLNCSGDGVMAYLEIPRIQVQLPVLHGTEEETLTRGVGHLEGSSLPVGGESTHAVLAGHRGLPSSALFTDLNLIEEGDLFYIHVLGETLAYEVEETQVVEPDETESLGIVPEKDLVTLVTCTPYGVNSHRLLVRGHRTEYDPETYEQETGSIRTSFTTNYVLIVCLGLLVVGIVALLLWMGSRKRRKRAQGSGKKDGKRQT